MSRLDSAIRRLEAQRLCLDRAVRAIAGQPGPVLELGLGNGRTYDHLRERLTAVEQGEGSPPRDIYVFDRHVAAHPDCIPPADRMIVGDFGDTLARAAGLIDAPAAFAHCDIGSGDPAGNARIAAIVGHYLPALMAENGLIVADQPLDMPGWTPLDLPEGVAEGRIQVLGGPGRHAQDW